MKMTLEQHLELGERVKEFRETLMQSHVINIGTKSSRESRAVRRALKYIDLMKSDLDSVVCHDFPGYPDATQIYYGMSKAWIARDSGLQNETRANDGVSLAICPRTVRAARATIIQPPIATEAPTSKVGSDLSSND